MPQMQCAATTLLAALPTLAAVMAAPQAPSASPPAPGTASQSESSGQSGMAWIPGGEFTMGTDDPNSYPQERPAHRVRIDGFWMDVTEVTNEQFKAFVDATGHVTIAEKAPDWEQLKQQLPPGTPKPSDEMLVPGAVVFKAPSSVSNLDDVSQWWAWTPGASWRHPEGPASTLDGRWNHPVVHIAWPDAVAYAEWAKKRLPSEAEWEFAARGGLDHKEFAWGDESRPGGRFMANIWQGRFPVRNLVEDGFGGTAPVGSFPSNGFGLKDMTGNVWEWCADWYDAGAYAGSEAKGVCHNPRGPTASSDPSRPFSKQRVIRGGSFLCADNYCRNYRPSARRGEDWDTGMSHLGFRCVKDASAPAVAAAGSPAPLGPDGSPNPTATPNSTKSPEPKESPKPTTAPPR